MSKLRNFLSMVGKSLNPSKYEELHKTSSGTALAYFFMAVLFTFLVMCLLFIPQILTSGSYIQDKLEAFDELKINIEYDQAEPIYIPEKYPILTIDTINNYTTLNQGMMLITDDATYYRILPFGNVKVIEDSEDLLERSDEVSNFLSIIGIMMVPMIMAFSYVYFTLKFLLIAIIGGFVGFMFARIARLSFDVGELIKLSFYASTIMILIGLLTKPFVQCIYFLDVVMYAIFFLLVMIKLGEFEEIIRPEDKKTIGLKQHHPHYHERPKENKEPEIGLLKR